MKKFLNKNIKNAPQNIFEAFFRTLDNIKHCYPRENDVIWSTVQRAGYYWLCYMYTIICVQIFFKKKILLNESIHYRHMFYRHLVIRYDFQEDKLGPFRYDLPIPRLLHTHGMFSSWMKKRKLLLQIRNPYDLLISKYYFNQYDTLCSFSDFLETEDAKYVPQFFNSWCPALKSFDSYLIIKFEDLKEDTKNMLIKLFSFLNLPEPSDDILTYAIRETSIQKIRRLHEELSHGKNISHGRSGRVNQMDELNHEEKQKLIEFVRKTIKYSFDYEIL